METITILITPFWQGAIIFTICTSAVWVGVIIALMQISQKYQKKKASFAENVRKN